MGEPTLCSQCRQRPAMYVVDGHPLCLSDYRQLLEVYQIQAYESERMMNYLSESIERSVGMRGIAPRFPERRPPVLAAQVGTVIQLNNSVTGAINTGTVQRLEATLNEVSVAGETGLAEQIRDFVELVAQDEDLDQEQKNTLAEQSEYLAQQASLPPGSRNVSAARAVLAATRDVALTVTAVAGAWHTVEPTIRAALGL